MHDVSTIPKAASVLVPILQEDKGYQVLFTVRSAHLKHHPGQIGFPGGAAELVDDSSQATALREAFEEVALDSALVTLLFDLPQQYTSSDYQVTPWVALVRDYQVPPCLSDEVASVLKVPLSVLLELNTYQPNQWTIAAGSVHMYQFYWEDQLIWGVTASICHSLCMAAKQLKLYL